jgi:hypothetical protein
MVVGNVEQLDLAEAFGERRFDVVLCLDVLEHLVEPLPVLRRLASLLTPTGILVASIPNVTHAAVRLQLLDGKFSYTDTGLLDRTHVRFFDRDEVGRLFADAGTTVIERLEVRREPHETEIPVDLSAVPEETLAAIKADPDARVFQWIIVARAGVEIEGEATGLTTALLAQTGQLERAVRESADHIAWLEGHLAAKTEHEQQLEHQATTLSNRILELDATLRERVGELLVLDEQVKALRADQTVKEAYVAQLQQSLGIEVAPAAGPAPEAAWQTAAPVHALVDRAATRLQRSPRTYRVLKAAARRVRRR